jgi:hypothetical protein
MAIQKAKPEETPVVDQVDTDPVPEEADTPEWAPVNDYVFVTFPDGKLHAVPRADVEASNALTNLPAAPKKAAKEAEFYAHLANGDVVRLKASQLPEFAGAQNPHGFHIADGHAHMVVGVYPVETPHIDSPDD